MNTEQEIKVNLLTVIFFTEEVDNSYDDAFGKVEIKYIDLDDSKEIRVYDANNNDLNFHTWSVQKRSEIMDAIMEFINDL